MTGIDLSKQQALDPDSKAIPQINFTGNLDDTNKTFFSIIEEAKEHIIIDDLRLKADSHI